MVLADGIVKVLAASKNTSFSPQYKYSQSQGHKAEQAVIIEMQSRGWQLLFQRAKTSIAEIDLIFQNDRKILLVEVKKLNDAWRAFERIGDQQIQKLQSNLILFSSKYPQFKLFAQLCWVDQKDKVYFVDLS